MALEDDIKTLIAVIKENTEALTASMQVRTEALNVAKATVAAGDTSAKVDTAAADKAAADKAAAAEKKAAAAAEKAAAEKAAAEKAAAEKAATDSAATDHNAALRELIAAYFNVSRKEERAARQAKVIALLNHPKIKNPAVPADAAPDTGNIAPEAVELFKSQMKLLADQGDLTVAEDAPLF